MSELVDTLKAIVDIPSEVGSEGRLCTALEERMLASWGREGVQRIGNSLVVGRRTGRPLISLFGHIDTVPSQGQGPARIEGGQLVGLGASDMKSGVAVMLHLMEDDEVVGGSYDLVSVFYDKEEGPAHENGLGPVLERAEWLVESELALVLEPSDLEVQIGCQGFVNARLVFEGTAAHSARPWLGENAITKAGLFLDHMHVLEPTTVEIDGLEFVEVFSITEAHGGVARNIIPARFELNLNYRFSPERTEEEAVALLEEVAAAADRVEIIDTAPGAAVPVGNAHLDRFEALADAPRSPKQGWTDVASLSARGIPAINYGPGVAAMAHKPEESVPLANLDQAYRVLREFLTS